MITVNNDGPLLISTNYFYSDHAKAGFAYLSWNAGAARLIIPDNRYDWIPEIKTGKSVIIEHSADGIVIVFDDGSNTPFCITVDHKQTDRAIIDSDIGKNFLFITYTSNGEIYRADGVFE